MGLLDQMMGGAMRGNPTGGGLAGGLGGMLGGGSRGGMGNKLAMGVMLALLVKAARDQSRPAEGRSFDGARGGAGEVGGMSGGGLGGLLGGLGGAGALGGLLGQLKSRGLGAQADSWVSTGQNQQVAPQQLAEALGDDTVEELQQQTGMSRDALLGELAHELPEAINQATPSGQLPDDDELHRMVQA